MDFFPLWQEFWSTVAKCFQEPTRTFPKQYSLNAITHNTIKNANHRMNINLNCTKKGRILAILHLILLQKNIRVDTFSCSSPATCSKTKPFPVCVDSIRGTLAPKGILYQSFLRWENIQIPLQHDFSRNDEDEYFNTPCKNVSHCFSPRLIGQVKDFLLKL